MISLLSSAFCIVILVSIAYYCFCLYAIESFFKVENNLHSDFTPAISILKPLCGLEKNLEKYLTSFINQRYPQYQIIFCVREQNDSVISLVEKLIKKFPQQDLKLVVSDRIIGHNYKVSNLANGLEYCKHDLILMADSDIEVREDYLTTIVQPLKNEKVGVVTCLYQSHGNNFISILESLSIAGHFIPNVLTAEKVEGIQYAFGSTILIRKKVLQEIGSFSNLANSLADDFLLGNLPKKLGYQVVLSHYLVEHHIEEENLSNYIDRQIRWYRGIRVQRFAGYLGLLLTQGNIVSVFFALISLGSPLSLVLLLISFFSRLLMLYKIGIEKLKNKTIYNYLELIVFVDFLIFYVWFIALFGNRIRWRNHEFILDKQGQLTPNFKI